jgi:DnaJ like chaperone protein
MSWTTIKEMIGLGNGGALRGAFGQLWSMMGLDSPSDPERVRNSDAFAMAFIALAAKMAKSDGIAVESEREAFDRFFRVPPEDYQNVSHLFDLAKEDVAGFELYAEKIGRLMGNDPEMVRELFACLFQVAAADGVLHHAEERYLEEVAHRLGLSAEAYRDIRRLFVCDSSNPYAVLGLEPDADNDALRARHRSLVKEHHPDQLQARGVPPELLKAADQRLANINAAYDQILTERGLKERAR